MKSFVRFTAAILLTLIFTIPPRDVVAQNESPNFQVFYDNLSPYGQWVSYGVRSYAWVPSAGSDFIPYSSAGHWVWTSYGWTWASDYSWGWAPFHYGRWDYDNSYGWVWIPDNVWGPAWVSWRRSSGYYGWTPLSPGFSFNLGFDDYVAPDNRWCFVDNRYMGQRDIYNHYGSRSYNNTYIRNSTVINNVYVDNNTHTTYIRGPRREEVQKATGREIRQVPIRDFSTPGEQTKNNELSLFRPHISKTNIESKPMRIAEKKEITPAPDLVKLNNQSSVPPSNNPKIVPNVPPAPSRIFNKQQNKDKESKDPLEQQSLQQEQLRKQQVQQEQMRKQQMQQDQLRKLQMDKDQINQQQVHQEQLKKQQVQQDQMRKQQMEQDQIRKQQIDRDQINQQQLQQEQLKKQQIEKDQMRKQQMEQDQIRKQQIERDQINQQQLQQEQSRKQQIQQDQMRNQQIQQDQLNQQRIQQDQMRQQQLQQEQLRKQQMQEEHMRQQQNQQQEHARQQQIRNEKDPQTAPPVRMPAKSNPSDEKDKR